MASNYKSAKKKLEDIMTTDYQVRVIEDESGKKVGNYDVIKPTLTRSETAEIAPVMKRERLVDYTKGNFTDLAPVKKNSNPLKTAAFDLEGSGERTWLQTGAFRDGYDFGDVTRTVFNTASGITNNANYGFTKGIEGVLDFGLDLVSKGADAVGANGVSNTARKIIQKDLSSYVSTDIGGSSGLKTLSNLLNGSSITQAGIDTKEQANKRQSNSVLGDKSNSLVQSAGQIGVTLAAQAGGVPWWLTTGAMSYGNEVEQAYKSGATSGEAAVSGAFSAAGEVLSEFLSGGMSKFGIGGKSLTDGLVKNVAGKIEGKILNNLAKFGIDVVGEGAEEVASELISRFGQKISYEDEKTWKEMFASEEAIDAYIESFVGGAVLSGGMNSVRLAKNTKSGRDYETGLTDNEQKVINNEIANRTAEKQKTKAVEDKINQIIAEREGTLGTLTEEKKAEIRKEVLDNADTIDFSTAEISKKELKAIEEEVNKDFNRGDISIESIENTLLGDVNAQINDLKTKLEQTTQAEERAKIESNISKLQAEKNNRMMEMLQKDNLLQRSYQEANLRNEKFAYEANDNDSEYRKNLAKDFEKVANNSTKSHELFETLSKISEDKGTQYTVVNNQTLKELGYSVEGRDINGFVTKNADGTQKVVINVDSAKALQKTVGHETTHLLEGTAEYTELQDMIKQYATTKGDYNAKLEEVTELYNGIKDADINAEVTSDLVGDYLFNDTDFINSLSVEKPNIFKKIYEEVKHLYKLATAGSKEARELEKVKKAFEKAYKQNLSQEISQNTNQSVEQNSEQSSDADTKYSLVSDKDTISFLENQDYVVTYKAMQVIDGKLYPPMSAEYKEEVEYTDKDGNKKTKTVRKLKQASELGKWQQSDENPDAIKKFNSKGYGVFELLKGNGKSIEAAYNPYEHTSNIVLNDQFEEAYNRPNLVTVEYHIPASELTSGYKAQYAKDAVGEHSWKAGPVAKYLTEPRQVYLTRWSKPVRILPDSEVAEKYKEILDGTDISVPFNVVSPSLLSELEKVGVSIDYDGSPMYKAIQKRKSEKESNVKYSISDKKGEISNVRTDEFRRLQEESQRLPYEEQQLYRSGSKEIDENLRSRLSRVLGERLEAERSSNSYEARILNDTKTGNTFEAYGNVDGQTFRDCFEIARTYTQYGELVDLHPVETTEDEIGYNDTYNCISKDGLSGYAITKDGDLISVFNASNKRGWLRAISPDVKQKSKTLDCYMSENQPLSEIYSAIFGFKTASVMDYNIEYDHDNIAKNHNYPQVAFMVNTDEDVETKHFSKDQYDAALEYRNSFVNSDDIAPIGNAQYSLTDNKGRKLSKEQQEYFKNSKVRDENGNLKVMYHGTDAMAFSEFNVEKGVWLSEEQSYAEDYADYWDSQLGGKWLDDEVYNSKDTRMYELYADIRNPFNLGEINDTLSDSKIGELADALGFGVVDNTGSYNDGGKVSLEIRNLAKKYIGEPTYQFTRSKEFIDYVKDLGYDGFSATEDGTKTYCAFNSADQVKLVNNTTPTESPDIRYSVSKTDNKGRELSKEQQEYFKNTVVKDTKGNLKTVFHSTNNKFNVFGKGDIGYHFGNKTQAKAIGGVNLKEGYLNITNPINFDDDLGSWDSDYRLTEELYDKGIITFDEGKYVLFTESGKYKSSTEESNKKLRELLISKGYDGIVYRNFYESGGGKSYIAFNSNQFKNVDNTTPTENPDIRYSVSKRNAEYDNAVKNNDIETAQKLVDEAAKESGYPIKAYHGTGRADRVGNVFLPERATSGPMAFFTDNRKIAENYARDKRDTSIAYDSDFDTYETQFRIKIGDRDIPLIKAWGYLPFDARRRITQKAGQVHENWDTYDGTLVVDENTNEAGGGFQWQLKSSGGNALKALNEQWLNSGTLFNEESRYLDVLKTIGVDEEFAKAGLGDIFYKDPNARFEKVYDTYLGINNPFDTSTMDENFINELEQWADETDLSPYEKESSGADFWDKNDIDAYDFADRLRSDLENGTFHAWTSIPDSVTAFLKEKGYDGIKDVGGKNGGEGHTVWIPFSSEQVKSADAITYDDNGNVIPLSERFNPEKVDIRNSLSMQGRAYGRERGDIFGSDIKYNDTNVAAEEIAPVKETVNENVENTNYAPAPYEAVNRENEEAFNALTDEDAPVEKAIYAYEERDKSRISNKYVSEIVNTVANPLFLGNKEKSQLKKIFNQYSKGEIETREDLVNALNDKFAYYDATLDNERLQDLKKEIRGTTIYVPQLEQGDVVSAYDKFGNARKKYFGYLNLTKQPVNKRGYRNMTAEQVYDEFAESYPDFFPDDIVSAQDKLDRIFEVLQTPAVETYQQRFLTNEDINTIADYMIGQNSYYQGINKEKSAAKDLKDLQKSIKRGELNAPTEEIAPVKEIDKKEAVPTKENPIKNNNAAPSDETIARVLSEEPKTQTQRNRRKLAILAANILDKGIVFENLSLKTKNRDLMGKWDYTLTSEARAQNVIGNGHKEFDATTKQEYQTSKSLNDIREEVDNSGKTQEFYDYMYHKHNVDRMSLESRYENTPNKAVFGDSVTSEVSQGIVDRYEAQNPEFLTWAQDVYDYVNADRQHLVDAGVISQETADLWQEMYPHYVPIRRVDSKGVNIDVPLDTRRTGVNAPVKRATGGSSDILPLFDTMAQRTLQTYRAAAKNSFGVELMNTLGSEIESAKTSVDDVINSVDSQESLLQQNDGYPTFTVFENGERHTFEITQDMYDALSPVSDSSLLSKTFAVPNKIANLHRGVLTEYNPMFTFTNFAKDVQDVLMNSQHAAKTYAKFGEALVQLGKKGYWYREYVANGGEQNSYFDSQENTFKTEGSFSDKLLNMPPLKQIAQMNDFIEMIPRLSEYIASRESGRSVEVSMLDAARVTTNFKAGGNLTKFANRNGATFLNASVQGAMQQVRNVREAQANGVRGWAALAAKTAAAGLPALLLNAMLWEDDDDYEELSDYVKQNYYIVAKNDDGTFVRIPKGRTLAVIQNGIEQMQNLITGDDEVDLKEFIDLVINNLAPNNPLTNNVISPIIQVANNTTWYGGDLVPTALQDLPNAEQYDEGTDSFSKWLGETFGISPIKANYLLNQYSGGVGDVVLPFMTPEATNDAETVGEQLLAPFKSKFTTNAVMNNQNVSDFWEKSDELTTAAKKSVHTDEDVLANKYFNSVKSQISELNKQKREVQSSDISKKEKYNKVLEIQKQINELAKNALGDYEDVNISGNYATVSDRQYKIDNNGDWTKLSDKQIEKQTKISNMLGISANDYWNADADTREVYSWAVENPDKYAISRVVTDNVVTYKNYTKELNDLKADKSSNGKTISGSRKKKIINYINNLDADYGAKLILYKSEYKSDDSVNNDIVEYLNGRNDITYADMVSILTQLDMKVDSNGNIYW
ncbi:MAG: hypothetical protein MJZ37_06230 [Bacilli bacterium]|nr:hypothetical protein [Bacilli bacterium]